MKKWQKGLLPVVVAIGLFVLVACGIKERKVIYEKEGNGYKSSLTFYVIGDKVTKQTADNVMPYSTIGAKTADEAKEKMKKIVNIYDGVKGIKHQITFGDDAMTENVEFDYAKLDLKKSRELVGMISDGDDFSRGVSLKKNLKC